MYMMILMAVNFFVGLFFGYRLAVIRMKGYTIKATEIVARDMEDLRERVKKALER